MYQARHGDVLVIPLVQAQKIHPWLKEKYDSEAMPTFNGQAAQPAPRDADGNVILALGETSGHMHAVMNPGVIVTAITWGDIVQFEVSEQTAIEHIGYDGPRDHDAIELPPGQWVKLPQRRYDPVLSERPVYD